MPQPRAKKPLWKYDVTLPDIAYRYGIKKRGPHTVSAYSKKQALGHVLSDKSALGADYRFMYERFAKNIDRYVTEIEGPIWPTPIPNFNDCK